MHALGKRGLAPWKTDGQETGAETQHQHDDEQDAAFQWHALPNV